MKKIIVFGKPRSFESYEFEFDDNSATNNKANSHIEPLLKPTQNQAVLHYFVKDGCVCLEFYNYAKAFDTDRQGCIFGVGIKTDKDLNLSYTINKVLIPFWKVFAGAFLNENDNFSDSTIIDALQVTKFGEEERHLIGNTTNNMLYVKPEKNKVLLLVADLDEIKVVESQIKKYSDIYIAGNQEIFKDDINKLLRSKNNLIYEIKEGAIRPLEEKRTSESIKEKTFSWGKKRPNGKDVSVKPVESHGRIENKILSSEEIIINNGKDVSVKSAESHGSIENKILSSEENIINNGNDKFVKREESNDHSEGLRKKKRKRDLIIAFGIAAIFCIIIMVFYDEIKQVIFPVTETTETDRDSSKIKKDTIQNNVKVSEPSAEETTKVEERKPSESKKTDNENGTSQNQTKKDENNTEINSTENEKLPKVNILLEMNKKTVSSGHTFFYEGNKFTATAESDVDISNGEWKFEDAIFAEKNKNPTNVEILSYPTNGKTKGEAILSYIVKGKQVAAVKIRVKRK